MVVEASDLVAAEASDLAAVVEAVMAAMAHWDPVTVVERFEMES